MRFRISHILLLMIFVAFFSFLMSSGSYIGFNLVRFVSWLLCGLLTIRAIVRPGRERLIILSGLLLGLSYMAAAHHIFTTQQFPTSQWLNNIYREAFDDPASRKRWNSYERDVARVAAMGIGEYAFAYSFGFLGAWIAAYWTKSDDVNKK